MLVTDAITTTTSINTRSNNKRKRPISATYEQPSRKKQAKYQQIQEINTLESHQYIPAAESRLEIENCKEIDDIVNNLKYACEQIGNKDKKEEIKCNFLDLDPVTSSLDLDLNLNLDLDLDSPEFNLQWDECICDFNNNHQLHDEQAQFEQFFYIDQVY